MSNFKLKYVTHLFIKFKCTREDFPNVIIEFYQACTFSMVNDIFKLRRKMLGYPSSQKTESDRIFSQIQTCHPQSAFG